MNTQPIIDENLIEQFLSAAESDICDIIINNGSCLGPIEKCCTQDQSGYDNHLSDALYVKRYFSAYYTEHCVLANNLYLAARERGIKNLNIASFGCGLFIDFFALNDNLREIDFSYSGYDLFGWGKMGGFSQSFLPKQAFYYKKSVLDLTQREINAFDVFVFPKSLSDIRNGFNSANGLDIKNDNCIKDFAEKIAATTKDRIFFLNSYVYSRRDNWTVDGHLFSNAIQPKIERNFDLVHELPLGDLDTCLNRHFYLMSQDHFSCPIASSCQKSSNCEGGKSPIRYSNTESYISIGKFFEFQKKVRI